MKLRTPLTAIFASQFSQSNNKRWMVVDENHEVLDSAAMLLERLGHAEVYKFRSGEEALNCFALFSNDFELVITDFELPGFNGVELCRRMRNISSPVKIILSTGGAITPERFAMHSGFDGVLQKPYSVAALWQVVRSILPEQEI
jgi:two-component system, cell cycle sensor histidine kinase and response regulator CckA